MKVSGSSLFLATVIICGTAILTLILNADPTQVAEPEPAPESVEIDLAECYGQTLEVELITEADINHTPVTVLKMRIPTNQNIVIWRVGGRGTLQREHCGAEPILTYSVQFRENPYSGDTFIKIPNHFEVRPSIAFVLGAVLPDGSKIRGKRSTISVDSEAVSHASITKQRSDGWRGLRYDGDPKQYSWVQFGNEVSLAQRTLAVKCGEYSCTVDNRLFEQRVSFFYAYNLTDAESFLLEWSETFDEPLPDFRAIDNLLNDWFASIAIGEQTYREASD